MNTISEASDPIARYPGTGNPMFSRIRPSGEVTVVREGNTVAATMTGVTGFKLSLSPNVFDFNASVTVIANGETVFDGIVQPGLETRV